MFNCGDDDLNDFLKNDALEWQKKKIASTHIFIYYDEIVGFYCCSADSIRLNEKEKEREHELRQKRIKEVPAIKIGRLARSVNYPEQGLGRFILQWAIGHVLHISENVGIRFVTVDSYPERVSWYEKFGFKRNLHKMYEDSQNISLRLCIYSLEHSL